MEGNHFANRRFAFNYKDFLVTHCQTLVENKKNLVAPMSAQNTITRSCALQQLNITFLLRRKRLFSIVAAVPL